MSNYRIKGLPPIKLQDLLRKRRTSLKDFVKNTGIVSYTTLLQKCQKMGVSAPDETEFVKALGKIVSSPQEGVVVLDPPLLVKDTGKKVTVDEFINHEPVSSEDTGSHTEEFPEQTSQLSTAKFKKKKLKLL